MWFFGSYKVGKTVGSLRAQAIAVNDAKVKLATDLAKAIEARNTVIATIGEEIGELKLISTM